MGFDPIHRSSWLRALTFGAALCALPMAACAGNGATDVAQSADTLKGGVAAGGKDKDKTNSGKHMGAAGSRGSEMDEHGRDRDAGAQDEPKSGQGKGQGAAGDKGNQGQGHAGAGAGNDETHGKSGQAHAGSHAQGPKAGHGADDMDDDADETDETP